MAEQSLLHRPSGGQVFGTLAASPAARLCWIGALISVAMIYIASFGKMPVHPGFGDGPSIYIASAQSLAQGTGYRLMYYPQAPPAQLYPIGYPLLLSPIFRVFPFGATSIFLARLINVAGVMIWAEASRRFLTYILDPLLSACGAMAMALTPLALEMGGQVKADIVFGAIVMVAIAVAIGHPAKESTRQALVRGVVIGLLGAASMLVRTIGFTLLFGLTLEMLLNRRWVRFVGFAAAGAVVLAPWLLWTFFHNGGTFQAYTSENIITWRTPISNFWTLAVQTAPSMAFAPLDRIAYTGAGLRMHLSFIPIVFGLTIVALVVLGWTRLLMKRHLAALVIGPYMGIVFLWWFEPTRFVVPVLPLLVFCACEGIRSVLSKSSPPTRQVALAAGLICITGAVLVDGIKVERALKYNNIDGVEAASDWSQVHQGLNWIKQNTPPDAVVFSSYPAGVYLFTSRHTLDLNNGTHIGGKFTPTNSMDLDAQFRAARAFPSAYVFATFRYDYILKEEWGLGPVLRFVESHPDRLELQWASNNGQLYIYKIVQ